MFKFLPSCTAKNIVDSTSVSAAGSEAHKSIQRLLSGIIILGFLMIKLKTTPPPFIQVCQTINSYIGGGGLKDGLEKGGFLDTFINILKYSRVLEVIF